MSAETKERPNASDEHGIALSNLWRVTKMAATRIFLMGVIILFFGFQLRAVDTFVLNERVSSFVNKRIAAKQPVQERQAGYYDAYWGFDDPGLQQQPMPRYRQITPPRWLGWSFLSIGAILVFTAPAFR